MHKKSNLESNLPARFVGMKDLINVPGDESLRYTEPVTVVDLQLIDVIRIYVMNHSAQSTGVRNIDKYPAIFILFLWQIFISPFVHAAYIGRVFIKLVFNRTINSWLFSIPYSHIFHASQLWVGIQETQVCGINLPISHIRDGNFVEVYPIDNKIVPRGDIFSQVSDKLLHVFAA